MTITLQFNLPEEEHESRLALNSIRIASTLLDVDERIRMRIKHGAFPEQEANCLQWARDQITEALEDHNLTREDL